LVPTKKSELITARDAEVLVRAYFDGAWKALSDILPPFGGSSWKGFVLQCGTASFGRWMNDVERNG
jgi:hypothetical protein